MKAFSYKRWSSDKQTKGDSLTRQSNSARAICASKGWELDETLAPDSGISAFKGRNLREGSIAIFRDAVKAGTIKTPCVLILDDMSRLTRLPISEALEEVKEILSLGVIICTANDTKEYTQQSLNSLSDMVSLIVSFEGNNKHSAELKRKVGDARKRFREQAATPDRKLKGWKPGWLDLDKEKNRYSENKHAKTVNRIFQDYANGKGLRTIVRELNVDGIPTFGKGKQNHGNGWAATHMRRILASPSVIGTYQPHIHIARGKREPIGEPIPNYYPAVIEKSLFYKVQNILQSKTYIDPSGKEVARTGQPQGQDDRVTNLFKGFITCAHCGAAMHIVRKPSRQKYNYVSLFCSGSIIRGGKCDYGAIQNAYVERAVLSTIWAMVIPAMSKSDTRAENLIALQGDLKVTKEKLAKLEEMMIENPSKAAMSAANALEAKQAQLTKEIESVSAMVAENPLSAWQQIPETPDTRRELRAILANEIEALKIDAKGRKATLVMKSGITAQLSWDSSTGANQVKVNPASEGFYLNGKKAPYVDNQLVWKTDKSINLEAVREHFGIKQVKYNGGKVGYFATRNTRAA
jgi:DNA invertase Pin-like site-specific DNA recombinase